MKVLNLYAGIGGNRKLWEDVEVTAVEIEPKIAQIYQDFFPEDEVIIEDAHQFLLDNYEEFDFIWSSPPCVTHTRIKYLNYNQSKFNFEKVYPDMNLYQEIIFLDTWFDGLYCVENVNGYYKPLIPPQVLDRHFYWANFFIRPVRTRDKGFREINTHKDLANTETMIKQLEKYHGFDLSKYDNIGYKKGKISLLRNCVFPPHGKHILDCARGQTVKPLTEYVEIKIHE